MNKNWIMAGAAAISLVVGIALSHLTEAGVHVEKVTLAGDTPALKFSPTGPGPHPVALLAHGYAGSKETLFRYGEALTAAGFVCYSVDQPGHGESSRKFTVMDAAHTLEAVAREIGPVDVVVGQSMGGWTGGAAVREGGVKPKLFIAVGSWPVLGDHGPPLIILFGQFDQSLSSSLLAYLNTRTDARLVFSPWSDHLLEGFDPVLVNAAVGAACAALHQNPPSPPAAWRWRLLGAVLAMLAAGVLASCLTDLFPRLARFRGFFIGTFVVAAFVLTFCGRWIDPVPHLRVQLIAMPVAFILAIISDRLRIPRWSFAALGAVLLAIGICWFKTIGSHYARDFMAATIVAMPALIAGIVIGRFASRRGSRLQGNIAMAIFVGCAPFQCLELPRAIPEAPRHIVQLDTKLLDACVGKYEIVPDNVFGHSGVTVTISRKDDHLIWQGIGGNARPGALDLYPLSETNFFLKINGAQITFVKNDQGEVTALIHHRELVPDSEGKKIKSE